MFSTNGSTSFQLLLSLFHFLFISSSGITLAYSKIPQLGIQSTRIRDKVGKTPQSDHDSDFKTFYYTQKLDHFNYKPESYKTFKQRYVINFKHWHGANTDAPIFAYLGAEAPLEDLGSIGFLMDNAPSFKALLVYIEHRYYGRSKPFGSTEEAWTNPSMLGYFNSAQAIADYAAILLHLKKKLSAMHSPIIVVGGSYGGMLAAWFRLKYPHVALGALASSAPVLYFDGIPRNSSYYAIVTKDFEEASKSCYKTIRKSWAEIDRVAARPGGVATLAKKFKTCSPLKSSSELKDYLDSVYCEAAQYDLPSRFVRMLCSGIDGAPKGTDLLGRVLAGVDAMMGNDSTCQDMSAYTSRSETNLGWNWQTCSEMVMPVGHDKSDTMFPTLPFNRTSFDEDCVSKYGVKPRPHWITTYYGGIDFKLILQRFGSNIIFSNGLRDPYSAGGVLEDISDTILAVYTTEGSHCLDLNPASKKDPAWLAEQREKEVNIVRDWLAKYHEDLMQFKAKRPIFN